MKSLTVVLISVSVCIEHLVGVYSMDRDIGWFGTVSVLITWIRPFLFFPKSWVVKLPFSCYFRNIFRLELYCESLTFPSTIITSTFSTTLTFVSILSSRFADILRQFEAIHLRYLWLGDRYVLCFILFHVNTMMVINILDKQLQTFSLQPDTILVIKFQMC